MKHNKYPQQHPLPPTGATSVPALATTGPKSLTCEASPDEVARRAYFTYVNQGSLPGHDVQHWLEAEAQLLAERNLTRVHGFHNPT